MTLGGWLHSDFGIAALMLASFLFGAWCGNESEKRLQQKLAMRRARRPVMWPRSTPAWTKHKIEPGHAPSEGG